MTTDRDQPLRRHLAAQADRLRAEYLRHGFSRDDYHLLVDRADAITAAAAAMGVPPGALAAVRDSRNVLASVLRLLEDPSSATVAPTNAQVYEAALIIARLARLTAEMRGAPAAWQRQLGALLAELDAGSRQGAERLVLLEFAGICRASGIRIEPVGQDAGPIGAEITFEDWTFAAVPAIAESAGSVAQAAARGCQSLRQLRRPGIVVIDAGSAMPDAPSLRRVGNDRTGELEMQRHVDQFIIDQHDAMVRAVDTQFAFAAAVGAVLQTVNVSAGRVNFAACYRVVNLCEPEDARAPRLRRFMERFSRPVNPVR
ncbi:MAG: hypothetical protein Kow0022_09480 [Phycisphaerales bacterium]